MEFFRKLKVQYQMIIPIIFIFFLVIIARIVTAQMNLTNLGDTIISETIVNIPEKIKMNIDSKIKVTAERASLLADNSKLIELFYYAQYPADGVNKKEARKEFTDYLDSIVNEIKDKSGEKTVKIHFHTADMKSFYRCWKKNKYGDDLSNFRKTIVDANKTKKIIKGMEVGKGAIPVRAIIPIKYKGKWIGTFEYMEDIRPLFRNEKTKNMTVALFIDSKTMKGAHRELKEKYRFNDLYLATSNNINVLKKHKKIFNRIIEKAYLGKKEVLQEESDYITAIPYKDYSGNIIGVILVHYDKHEIIIAKNSVIKKTLMSAVVAISIIFMLLFFISKLISKPILELKNFFKEAASGETDLTLRLKTNDSNNETNEASVYFNKFISNLQEIIINLERSSQKLNKSSNNLRTKSNELNKGSLDTQNKSKNINKSLKNITIENNNITKSINEITEDVNNLQKNLNNINKSFTSVENDSGYMKEMILNISSAIEQMHTTISEISNNTLEASDVADKTSSDALKATLLIKELNNSVQSITNVVILIEEIASQTNLLALNATIEAASAGEAGKGFAVVANEIKNLANQTASATKKISTQVQEIQDEMENSVKYISNMSNNIEKVNSLNSNIASAVEEQNTTVSEISNNIQQTLIIVDNTVKSINNIGEQIESSSSNINYIDKNVVKANKQTIDINTKLNNSMKSIIEMTDTSIKLYENSQNVNIQANETLNLSENLDEIVEKFKI